MGGRAAHGPRLAAFCQHRRPPATCGPACLPHPGRRCAAATHLLCEAGAANQLLHLAGRVVVGCLELLRTLCDQSAAAAAQRQTASGQGQAGGSGWPS
jgi:hypothetical protein